MGHTGTGPHNSSNDGMPQFISHREKVRINMEHTDTDMRWCLHWWYSDRSGCGVVPCEFNNREKEIVELVLNSLPYTGEEWEFVPLGDRNEIQMLRNRSPHLSDLASLLRVTWRKNGDLIEGACWEIRRLRKLCEESK